MRHKIQWSLRMYATVAIHNYIAIGLHGFNVSDGGAGTVDRFLSYFPNRLDANYGHIGLYGVLSGNDNRALMLQALCDMSDCQSTAFSSQGKRQLIMGVGHSNACALFIRAAQAGAKLDCLVLINPALDPYVDIPDTVAKVIVIHTNNDKVVLLAEALRRLISPFNKEFLWGKMGNTGYLGNDKRVTNIDLSGEALGHSDFFSQPALMQSALKRINTLLQSA